MRPVKPSFLFQGRNSIHGENIHQFTPSSETINHRKSFETFGAAGEDAVAFKQLLDQSRAAAAAARHTPGSL
jgi:hypothetical protein